MSIDPGVAMSSLLDPSWPTRQEHVPMSLDEYLALSDQPKAEYVDGVLTLRVPFDGPVVEPRKVPVQRPEKATSSM